MGLLDRLSNLWTGFTSLWMGNLETRNPEAVYEAAINERIRKYGELKKAVSNIVYLRNKTSSELQTKEKELKDVLAQLPIAVETGEDEVALVLIQKKDELTSAISTLSEELTRIEGQAEEAKAGLIGFQAEIEKLKREKDQMLAAKTTAEARIKIQDAISGLSLEADVAALDNVRTSIHKLKAEADIGAEVEGSTLDAKLKKIQAKASTSAAQGQLDEMKKQLAARKTASEGGTLPKTM